MEDSTEAQALPVTYGILYMLELLDHVQNRRREGMMNIGRGNLAEADKLHLRLQEQSI